MKKIIFLMLMPCILMAGSVLAAFGSLYDVQKSPYAIDVAKKPGDLLTVIVNEAAITKNDGQNNLKKQYDAFQFALEKFFLPKFGLTSGFKATMADGDKPGVSLNAKKQWKFDAQRSSNHLFETKLQVRLVEEIDRGSFLVKGHRTVNINGKTTKIFVSGVVRERDIGPDNTIASHLIADAIVEIDDELVSQDLKPGIIERILGFFF